jgi:hypothetical protein
MSASDDDARDDVTSSEDDARDDRPALRKRNIEERHEILEAIRIQYEIRDTKGPDELRDAVRKSKNAARLAVVLEYAKLRGLQSVENYNYVFLSVRDDKIVFDLAVRQKAADAEIERLTEEFNSRGPRTDNPVWVNLINYVDGMAAKKGRVA